MRFTNWNRLRKHWNHICLFIICLCWDGKVIRDHSEYGLDQWDKALHINASHWLSPYPGWTLITLPWRHNERDGVSNHQAHDCLLNRLFRRRSKKKSKLRVTGLCEGNSPVTGEFPTQRACNMENVSIWWRHHETSAPELPTSCIWSRPAYSKLACDLNSMTIVKRPRSL